MVPVLEMAQIDASKKDKKQSLIPGNDNFQSKELITYPN